jgi:hypothetical protein
MEDVGTSYANLAYFTTICYILWPSDIFYGHLVHIFPFWYVVLKYLATLLYEFVCSPATGGDVGKRGAGGATGRRHLRQEHDREPVGAQGRRG